MPASSLLDVMQAKHACDRYECSAAHHNWEAADTQTNANVWIAFTVTHAIAMQMPLMAPLDLDALAVSQAAHQQHKMSWVTAGKCQSTNRRRAVCHVSLPRACCHELHHIQPPQHMYCCTTYSPRSKRSSCNCTHTCCTSLLRRARCHAIPHSRHHTLHQTSLPRPIHPADSCCSLDAPSRGPATALRLPVLKLQAAAYSCRLKNCLPVMLRSR